MQRIKLQCANGEYGLCVSYPDGSHKEIKASEWQSEPTDEAKQDKIEELLEQNGIEGVWVEVEDGREIFHTGVNNG